MQAEFFSNDYQKIQFFIACDKWGCSDVITKSCDKNTLIIKDTTHFLQLASEN